MRVDETSFGFGIGCSRCTLHTWRASSAVPRKFSIDMYDDVDASFVFIKDLMSVVSFRSRWRWRKLRSFGHLDLCDVRRWSAMVIVV